MMVTPSYGCALVPLDLYYMIGAMHVMEFWEVCVPW